MATEIQVGTWVVTSDARVLGRVKAVAEEEFLVDAPFARDYWLERTVVRKVTTDQVDLLIASPDLEAYKMEKPHDPDGFHEKVPNTEASAVRDRNLWSYTDRR